MQYYLKDREKQEQRSVVIGLGLTVAAHILVAVFGVFTGVKYLYPPPEEKSILIEFEDVKQPPVRVRTGTQPRSVNADRTKRIELVKESEGQHEGTKQNLAAESTIGDNGDVEVPEPPREKEIDRRALFHSADNPANKDTLAAQTAQKVSDALSAGHASGNSTTAKATGEPNAKLKGRTVKGTLPSPVYAVQESGKVVVSIWVDNYGNVQKAVPGADGTTVTDKTLWNAARNAAMGAHFNMSADAPALQQGTITYIFNLK